MGRKSTSAGALLLAIGLAVPALAQQPAPPAPAGNLDVAVAELHALHDQLNQIQARALADSPELQ